MDEAKSKKTDEQKCSVEYSNSNIRNNEMEVNINHGNNKGIGKKINKDKRMVFIGNSNCDIDEDIHFSVETVRSDTNKGNGKKVNEHSNLAGNMPFAKWEGYENFTNDKSPTNDTRLQHSRCNSRSGNPNRNRPIFDKYILSADNNLNANSARTNNNYAPDEGRLLMSSMNISENNSIANYIYPDNISNDLISFGMVGSENHNNNIYNYNHNMKQRREEGVDGLFNNISHDIKNYKPSHYTHGNLIYGKIMHGKPMNGKPMNGKPMNGKFIHSSCNNDNLNNSSHDSAYNDSGHSGNNYLSLKNCEIKSTPSSKNSKSECDNMKHGSYVDRQPVPTSLRNYMLSPKKSNIKTISIIHEKTNNISKKSYLNNVISTKQNKNITKEMAINFDNSNYNFISNSNSNSPYGSTDKYLKGTQISLSDYCIKGRNVNDKNNRSSTNIVNDDVSGKDVNSSQWESISRGEVRKAEVSPISPIRGIMNSSDNIENISNMRNMENCGNSCIPRGNVFSKLSEGDPFSKTCSSMHEINGSTNMQKDNYTIDIKQTDNKRMALERKGAYTLITGGTNMHTNQRLHGNYSSSDSRIGKCKIRYYNKSGEQFLQKNYQKNCVMKSVPRDDLFFVHAEGKKGTSKSSALNIMMMKSSNSGYNSDLISGFNSRCDNSHNNCNNSCNTHGNGSETYYEKENGRKGANECYEDEDKETNIRRLDELNNFFKLNNEYENSPTVSSSKNNSYSNNNNCSNNCNRNDNWNQHGNYNKHGNCNRHCIHHCKCNSNANRDKYCSSVNGTKTVYAEEEGGGKKQIEMKSQINYFEKRGSINYSGLLTSMVSSILTQQNERKIKDNSCLNYSWKRNEYDYTLLHHKIDSENMKKNEHVYLFSNKIIEGINKKTSSENILIVTLTLMICISVLCNYDHGAIPVTLEEIQKDFPLSYIEQSLLGSLVYFGLIIGTIIASVLFELLSAKLLVTISIILLSISLYIFSHANCVLFMYISRFVNGLCQAIPVVYIPVWVDEFSPDKKATQWMSYIQLASIGGTVFGYFLGGILSNNYNCYNKNDSVFSSVSFFTNWRSPFLIQSFLLLPLFFIIIFIPSDIINISASKTDSGSSSGEACEEDIGEYVGRCTSGYAGALTEEYVDGYTQRYDKCNMDASKAREGEAYETKWCTKKNIKSISEEQKDVRQNGLSYEKKNNAVRKNFNRSATYIMEKKTNVLKKTFKEVKKLLNNRLYIIITLGMSNLYFVVTGIQFWITEYMSVVLLTEKMKIVTVSTLCFLTSPTSGVWFGGFICDLFGGYKNTNYFKTIKVATAFAISACIFGILSAHLSNFIFFSICLWLCLFSGSALVPVAVGMLLSCVNNHQKSLSSAVSQVIYNVFGWFSAPLLSGIIMDIMHKYTNDNRLALKAGFTMILYSSFIGFLLLLYANFLDFSDKKENEEFLELEEPLT
ncbi:major facilitator superfamily domain-containing protein, putative [Plasmodium malariae]|uniref:Major facilitator superfamily domain-containing protein, putative n=1 Tax=Plasmodium malariae TaxID=5858 RepID=A0A1D3JMB6_PLAMA|nr:major facilitator superfamily domain-containing protein, putative [Plasmodium malariae]SBT87814.1 major facilitator superfamily domain-containing protein, putative [Plasmodium malariae]